ncbi:MAG: DinB family protein [Dermabacter sp.]|nr:DinB family protein [Dermabacter sp.]
MTSIIDEQGRPEPPLNAGEWETLTGFLDYQRATFAWKTGRLTATQLAQQLPTSTMTLAGLTKHLAFVEDYWFGRSLMDEPWRAPWDAIDWKAEPDWDWDSAANDTPDALIQLWQGAVERARAAAESAYAIGGLEVTARRAFPDGSAPNLRWILTHMIEEYARHNGHADLLRESIDGEVGE